MEKNIIFYFSATGNSLKIAKDIASKLENCEIILVTKYNEKVLEVGYNRVGFVFPVFCADLPLCFTKFLRNTDFTLNKDAFFFSVVTGGGNFGNASYSVYEELQKQGIKLNSFNEIKMIGNYVALYDMPKEYGNINKTVQPILDKVFDVCINKVSSTNIPKQNKIVKTTSLAGGLLYPYKGLIPTCI